MPVRTFPILLSLTFALSVFGLTVDIITHGVDLITLGAFALIFAGLWLARKKPHSRTDVSLGIVCVGQVFFAVTALGVADFRAVSVGMMLGGGFILLLRSIEPMPPAGGDQQGA